MNIDDQQLPPITKMPSSAIPQAQQGLSVIQAGGIMKCALCDTIITPSMQIDEEWKRGHIALHSTSTTLPITNEPKECQACKPEPHKFISMDNDGKCVVCGKTPPPKEGRPTKYKPEYCTLLVDHMKKGFSFESFGAIADVSEDTLHEWKKNDTEFSESYKRGREYSRLFWESMGIDGAKGKPSVFKKKIKTRNADGSFTESEIEKQGNVNPALWIINMKNRFKWTDRQDITSDDEKLDTPLHYIPEENPNK